MNILVLVIVGAIAGFLADKVVKNTFGTLMDIVIGIAGSFIGTWVFSMFNLKLGGLIGDIIVAFVGAILLLLIINLFKGKK